MIRYIILSLAVVASSYAQTPSTASDSHLPIMPLKVGNIWIYRFQWVDSNGVVRMTRLDTQRVISKMVCDGETWYRLNNGKSFYINRADGLWIQFDSSKVEHWARYPTKPGATFGADTSKDASGRWVMRIPTLVASVDTQITVPAGTYRAILYTTRHAQRSDWKTGAGTEHYYVPGVGEIGWQLLVSPSEGSRNLMIFRKELVEAHLQTTDIEDEPDGKDPVKLD
jgi:hypothetical protein